MALFTNKKTKWCESECTATCPCVEAIGDREYNEYHEFGSFSKCWTLTSKPPAPTILMAFSWPLERHTHSKTYHESNANLLIQLLLLPCSTAHGQHRIKSLFSRNIKSCILQTQWNVLAIESTARTFTCTRLINVQHDYIKRKATPSKKLNTIPWWILCVTCYVTEFFLGPTTFGMDFPVLRYNSPDSTRSARMMIVMAVVKNAWRIKTVGTMLIWCTTIKPSWIG